MQNALERAKWIWAKDYDCPNMFLVAAAPSAVPADASGSWTLQLSVDSDFALLCEQDGQLRCLCFGQYTDYDTHKVCEVRSLDGEEMAGGRLYLLLTSQNCDTSTDRRERAGVIFSLCDGQGNAWWTSGEDTALYRTDRHVSQNVPLVTGQLGFSFDINLTAPLCGSSAAVQLPEHMPTQLYPRPIAPLRMGDPLPSRRVLCRPFRAADAQLPDTAFGVRMQRATLTDEADAADGWIYIYDLDAEQVGFLELDITVAEPAEMLVGWGEHLRDGTVRTDIGGRCFAGRVRLAAGRNKLLYPLRRLGLRYLQLNLYAPAHSTTVTYAGIRPVDYPLPAARPCPMEEGTLHARIYEVCLQTLRHCLHDHYEDCPWREQALYTMDSRNQMLCGYYAYGEKAAPRASLELIARSLREDGLLELCSPARCPITIPAFSAMFVVQLQEYVTYCEDLETARALLPVAQRIVDAFFSRMDEKTGLMTCYPEQPYWNFYEWQSGLEGKISHVRQPQDVTYDAPLCGFVSLAIASLAKLYETLGEGQLAERLLARRDALNAATHAAFFDPEAGLYDSYIRVQDGTHLHRAQLTQALMLLCGACPPSAQAALRAKLAGSEALLPVTLSHSIFRYDALLADPAYLPQILGEIETVWGAMLQAGATTFWETAKGDADFGNAGSLCHGWSAVPVYIYWKYAAK